MKNLFYALVALVGFAASADAGNQVFVTGGRQAVVVNSGNRLFVQQRAVVVQQRAVVVQPRVFVQRVVRPQVVVRNGLFRPAAVIIR